MKCDHCGVKRFVCFMYNCTDLNICAFRSSDKLSSPNSKVICLHLVKVRIWTVRTCVHVWRTYIGLLVIYETGNKL